MLSIDLYRDRSEHVHYDNPDYPIRNRRALLSAYPDYAVLPHWHDDLEFVVCLSGEMQYNINGEIVTIPSGGGIFVNSRQLHYGFSEVRTECDFFCIMFHPILLCITPAYERDYALPLLNNENLPYLILTPSVSWQEEILQLLHHIRSTRKERNAPLLAQIDFLTIWALLGVHNPSAQRPKSHNADLSILKSMVSYVQHNYEQHLTLADIASSGSVGQSKCCRLFSRYLHQTPGSYLTQYRISQSIPDLVHTTHSITEIAQAAGFNGSSYYAAVFRKAYGMTPGAYRKQHAAADSPDRLPSA